MFLRTSLRWRRSGAPAPQSTRATAATSVSDGNSATCAVGIASGSEVRTYREHAV